jgi:hypothetical protein
MFNRFLAAAIVAALLATPLTAPRAESYVDRNEAAAGAFQSGNAPHHVMPWGVIYEILATAAGATGTGEQTLGTYSLPANALDVAGRHLRITADFAKAANGNSVTPKLYFGSESLATAANTTSAGAMKIVCDVLKTGASTQSVNCWGLGGTSGVTPVIYSQPAATETDSSAITIKATCTGGTTGADCTLSDFVVEYLN